MSDRSSADTPHTLLQDILRQMGFDARVEMALRGSDRVYNILAADAGKLIGNKGENLWALQYLLRLMLLRRGEDAQNIFVDVNDYLAQQQAGIAQLAREQAHAVRRSGAPADLRTMTAYERRLVHLAVQEIQGVTTETRQEGPQKYVRILPETA